MKCNILYRWCCLPLSKRSKCLWKELKNGSKGHSWSLKERETGNRLATLLGCPSSFFGHRGKGCNFAKESQSFSTVCWAKKWWASVVPFATHFLSCLHCILRAAWPLTAGILEATGLLGLSNYGNIHWNDTVFLGDYFGHLVAILNTSLDNKTPNSTAIRQPYTYKVGPSSF